MKWLFGIVIIAACLRFFGLSSIPAGFTTGEVLNAYDAYSLMLTGSNSSGNVGSSLLSFVSIPVVAVFGLFKESVRLPSALLGVSTVAVVYFLAKELLSQQLKNKGNLINAGIIAVVASLLLTISPWHIMVSRVGLDIGLIVFLQSLGVFFYLKGLVKHKYLILSAIVFGLSLINSIFVFINTVFLLAILVLFFKVQLKKLTAPLILFTFFVIIAVLGFSRNAELNLSETGVFAGSRQEAAGKRLESLESGLPFSFASLFYNEHLLSAKKYVANYSSYLSYDFLFGSGSVNGLHGLMPGRGLLYLFELPFLVFFIYMVATLKKKRNLVFLFVWLIVSPFHAAIAGSRLADSTAVMVIPLVIISAVGAVGLYEWIRQKAIGQKLNLVITGYLMVILISVAGFFQDYFILSPNVMAKDMNFGNLEVAYWLTNNSADKTEIIISDSLEEMELYVAFANSWDPVDFRQQYIKGSEKTENQRSLGKYIFKDINWNEDSAQNALLIGKQEDFPGFVEPFTTLYYPNREAAIVIVDPYIKNYAKAF